MKEIEALCAAMREVDLEAERLQLIAERDRLREQRDELLVALKGAEHALGLALRWCSTNHDVTMTLRGPRQKVRAAIANAEGGASRGGGR